MSRAERWKLLSSAAAVVVVAVVAAPGAGAAASPSTITVGCSDAGFWVTDVVASPGDTITLEGAGGSDATCTLSLGSVAFATGSTFAGDGSLVITVLRAGTITVTTTLPDTESPTLTIRPPGVASSGPPSVVQQVGLPASGSCADVPDTGLDEGTGLRGGWSASWAYWPHHGSGGPVCTRTLSFRSGGWVLG